MLRFVEFASLFFFFFCRIKLLIDNTKDILEDGVNFALKMKICFFLYFIIFNKTQVF